MKQSTALESLIEFAQGQRDDALSRFATSMAQARAVEERLALLVNYRKEYAARLGDIICRGVAADQLRSFRLFLEKLDLAIGQQEQAANSQSEMLAERRALWTSKETRLKGYSRMKDRRGAEARQLMHRAEQRQTDEHASRIAAARTGDEG